MKIFDLTCLRDGLEIKATMTSRFPRMINDVIIEQNTVVQIFPSVEYISKKVSISELLFDILYWTNFISYKPLMDLLPITSVMNLNCLFCDTYLSMFPQN